MKTAIVTGGAGGIGLACSRALWQDGFCVAVMGRRPEDIAVQALAGAGIPQNDLLYQQGSIEEADNCEGIIQAAVARFGRLDVLVNNAGVAPAVRRDLLDMTEESFAHVMGVNVKGTLQMSRLAAKQMLRQPFDDKNIKGMIINISSVSAYTSSVNRGEYCMSKAAVSMMTALFADRLAGEGVLVYEIRPGIIATDMTAGVKEAYDALLDGGLLPLARWGTPEDVANAVSVLCSGKLGYSTGEVLNVDGGFHLRRL